MKTKISLLAILLCVTMNAQDFSVGAGFEGGKTIGANLDFGSYTNDDIFIGIDFGFGKGYGTINEGIYTPSQNNPTWIRGLSGIKFNNWLQIRVGAGIEWNPSYHDTHVLEDRTIIASGITLDWRPAWKAGVLIGPVELYVSQVGFGVGIKFIR